MDIISKTWNQLQKHYGNTGCALVLVKNGKLFLKQCFGTADIETGRKITEKSFFDIASCSKAFTTCLIAQLCDEGKMDWDTPVINYYPQFKMYDKYVESHITARDMASHRSGLSRHDLVRNEVLHDRDDYISRIAHYVPSCGFREKMQYQNQIYAALGYIGEKIDGKIWEDMIIDRIAKPLDMEIEFRGLTDLEGKDAALPHSISNGKIKRIPYNVCSANNPCGGVKTNIDSIEHWLLMLTNKGIYNGKPLISEKQYNELKKPVIYMNEPAINKNDKQKCYSLGWMPSIYKGRRLVSHGGSINGFNSQVGFLPDEGNGFAIFTNTENTPLCEILKYVLVDYLNGECEDDYEYLMLNQLEIAKKSAERKAERISKLVPATKAEIEKYSGIYYNEGYHNVKICESKKGNLEAVFADRHCELLKDENGVFLGEFPEIEITSDIRFTDGGAVMSFSENYSPTVFVKIK